MRLKKQLSSTRSAQRSSSPETKKNTQEDENEQIEQSCCRTPFFIKLLRYNAPERYYLFVGCVCSFLFGGVEPAVGLIYSIIYGLFAVPSLEDQASKGRDLSLSIFGIYVFAGIAQLLSTVTFTKSGEALTLRMRLLAFEAMLRQEIGWFDYEKNNVGSLVTRLSSDTAALKVTLGINIVSLIWIASSRA